jgi:hypothetical protein
MWALCTWPHSSEHSHEAPCAVHALLSCTCTQGSAHTHLIPVTSGCATPPLSRAHGVLSRSMMPALATSSCVVVTFPGLEPVTLLGTCNCHTNARCADDATSTDSHACKQTARRLKQGMSVGLLIFCAGIRLHQRCQSGAVQRCLQ